MSRRLIKHLIGCLLTVSEDESVIITVENVAASRHAWAGAVAESPRLISSVSRRERHRDRDRETGPGMDF